MTSLRKPGRGPLARATARALIAALLLGLLPSHTIASTTSPAAPARLYLGNLHRPLLRVAGEVLPRMAVVAWGPAILAKSAFGELLSHTGSDPQPYAFTGEALDQDSGWQYHRARWMDPRTGRWASMDPFGGFLSEPVTLLRYLYSGVDPVNKLDRNGEQFSTVQVLAIGAIIGILVANFRHPPQTIGQIASVNLGGAAAGVTVAGGFLGAQYLLFRLATYGAAGAGSAEAIHKSLEAAARSGGPTIGVTTAQTTAPAVGRTLYVVEGVGLEAQRAAAHFGPGRPLWEGQIPKQLFFELQRLGLVSDGYLPSGAKEIAFRAEASRYLVDFFTRIP